MKLKAITLATLSALALAGAACSDTEPQTSAEAPPTAAEIVPASAPANDGFNLAIPGEAPANAGSNDGFNLAGPDLGGNAAPSSDGFNLPADIPSGGGLESIPEFETPVIADEPATPAADEDAIIRLDP